MVVWHTAGHNRFSGDYLGPDAIVRTMSEVRDAATITNEPHDILASDNHVVVLVNTNLSREGESLDVQNVFVFHVNDGKVTEGWGMASDQPAVDAFWG